MTTEKTAALLAYAAAALVIFGFKGAMAGEPAPLEPVTLMKCSGDTYGNDPRRAVIRGNIHKGAVLTLSRNGQVHFTEAAKGVEPVTRLIAAANAYCTDNITPPRPAR